MRAHSFDQAGLHRRPAERCSGRGVLDCLGWIARSVDGYAMKSAGVARAQRRRADPASRADPESRVARPFDACEK